MSEAVRLAEYSTLRDELLQNKKYVFERPLLIITAAGIASVKLSGEPSLAFLPLLLVIVLLSNLWFTVNRLQSNARIIAYIAVVLESGSDAIWVGWENALRQHRMWSKRHTPEEQSAERLKYFDPCSVPDAMSFYPALWWLHLATVTVALVSAGAAVIAKHDALMITASALTVATAVIFLYYAFGPDRPGKMRDLIEVQTATWKIILSGPPGGNAAGLDQHTSSLSPQPIT